MEIQGHFNAGASPAEGGNLLPLERAPAKYVSPVAVKRRLAGAPIPQPARFPIPAHQDAVDLLAESIYRDFVEPALRAEDESAYVDFIAQRWHEFRETLRALHVFIARASSEERASEVAEESMAEVLDELRGRIVALAGAEAESELDFASESYLRALRVAGRFGGLKQPSDLSADRKLCAQFHNFAAIHFLGLFSLLAAAAGSPTSSKVVRRAFDLLRGGALGAYTAARQAMDLRLPAAEATGEFPMLDAGDVALAEADLSDPDD